jgi:hypothetical protein
MNIINRLSRVGGNNLQAVAITLESQFNTFVASGEMTAVLPNGEDPSNVNIVWEQIGGSAVTYTTPTDGISIGFTTSDLIRKTFKVYTNKGSTVEQSAIADFLHFPLDKQVVNNANRDLITLVQTNSINASNLLPAYKQNGLIAVDPTSPNYSISSHGLLASTPDSLTYIITDGTMSNDVIPYVHTSEVWERITGVWTLQYSTSNYIRNFADKVTVTNNEFKIVYKYNLRGYENSVTLLVDQKYWQGFSDRSNVNLNNDLISINNYQNRLQTSTSFSAADTSAINANSDMIVLTNYNSNLQTSTRFSSADTSGLPNNNDMLVINNYVQSLQTSTGAT